jgi:hypothetical protein
VGPGGVAIAVMDLSIFIMNNNLDSLALCLPSGTINGFFLACTYITGALSVSFLTAQPLLCGKTWMSLVFIMKIPWKSIP